MSSPGRLDLSGKPLIGMVHLAPLPGSAFYTGLSPAAILDAARRDLDALLEAGFDAVSFSNEGDRPYATSIPTEQVAVFTHVLSRLTADLDVPFGCGMLIDPRAGLAVARAIAADFVRLSLGTMVGSYGVLTEDPAEILRYRRAIGAGDVALYLNVSPHFSTPLDTRPLGEIVATTAFLCEPDAIQVHGPGAGVPPTTEAVLEVRDAVPGTPVIVASGVTAETVGRVLEHADGVIVGTSLKRDGWIWNAVDPARARAFVDAARGARGG
ncbi:MAG: BtpA/SgcQ family protein [Solirubrobacteraceae bacterium]